MAKNANANTNKQTNTNANIKANTCVVLLNLIRNIVHYEALGYKVVVWLK